MKKNQIIKFIVLLVAIPFLASAQKVGVFFDSKVPQIQFAANEVKAALEAKKFTVEMLSISKLNDSYANRKVVIALANGAAAAAVFKSEGGKSIGVLSEQAYSLQTTTKPQKTYWIFGGDANGAMYGGLQIAENIQYDHFNGNYNTTESPTILKRGIKLNLPWDKENGTYGLRNMGSFDGTSSQLAIKDVWDITFWKEWFDEMARNRYNTVSLWSCNPFSALVSVPGYEDCSIQDVTYFDGTVKKMTIDEKIIFWKEVMGYAHSRGFEFFIFNWNVFTYGATGKYGITDGKEGATDPDTKDYMYKAMTELLKTYPDLDGFGMSVGENKGTEEFVWETYGKAMYDYAKINPNRNLRFIHRLHYGDFSTMTSLFAPLRSLPNVNFDLSVKHSQAHMYSTPKPNWWPKEIKTIRENNLKTWLTVRNDDFYYLTWGDPKFAREYISGMLDLGSIFQGFYMGCDGYNPTRTFFYKDSGRNGQLEVLRQQYMMKIWGRLSYNPQTSDAVFTNYLAAKYPKVNEKQLFDAWSKASSGLQMANEMIQGNFDLDFKWWIEACQRDATKKKNEIVNAFVSVQDFANAKVGPGSQLCSIANSAAGNLEGKKSAYVVADDIEANAISALSLIKKMKANTNSELAVALQNIKAMSFLGNYYSSKIRAATHLKANKKEEARKELGQAYLHWMNYTNLMDSQFKGMTMQRSADLPDWHVHDKAVLQEYTDLGGIGIPK